jgi:glycosyltransferase involved in cell wall biosynthesis
VTSTFNIHSILLCKNEEDVIELCIRDACKWSDHIYVYDGQSTDNTWGIVTRLARGSSRIHAWKQDGKVFSEGLRAEVFNEFRHGSVDGDWWLQLNADEFYDEDPRGFLSMLPEHHQFVWGIPIQYYITDEDLTNLDFTQSFELLRPLLRHYQVAWSEPRFFRHRKRLTWSPQWAWPKHVGLVAKDRLYFKHYPYRSPRQIQQRLDTRRDNRGRGFEGWDHAKEASWKEKIVTASGCHVDYGDGKYHVEEGRLPRHLEPAPKRAIKAICHFTGIWP